MGGGDSMNEKYIPATSEINDRLCEFSMRWSLDGDYIRCRKCNRPQITNYMDVEFPHASSCKPTIAPEPHPWRTYLALMDELSKLAGKAPP